MPETRSPVQGRSRTAKKAPATPKLTRLEKRWQEADLEALKISPEVAYYMASRGFDIPTCVPLWKTPEPNGMRGAKFDPTRVDRVIASFRQLRHTKGSLAGRVFEPATWQIAYVLAPWAGWVAKSVDTHEYCRIITEMYVELPRKNGKTTLAGGIALYMTGADGEQGAQVLAAATVKEQATFVFEPMRQLVLKSAGLRAHLKPFKYKITHTVSGSYFKPIANAGDAQHGADIHCSVIDEVHLHKSMDLIDALETGTGSRNQPLTLFITTADAGKRNTPYAKKRERIEKLCKGVLKSHTTYGVIFAAEKPEYEEVDGEMVLVAGDDPFSIETMKKANPGFGVSPTKRFLVEQAEKAKESPADYARYLRLHLGIRTKQETRYLDVDNWDINAGIVVPQRLKGRVAYGGLDLSATTDLTSLVWVLPDYERGGYDIIARTWIPEDNVPDLDNRTAKAASTDWIPNGWLHTTPGNVIDYDFIKAQADKDMEFFDVQEIAYDPWGAQQLVNDMTAEGAPMVTMRQGFASLSAPTKDLQRFIQMGAQHGENGRPRQLMRHGGNPCLRWQVDNFAVVMDAAGNVKPDKENAGDKIDAVVALIMGLGRALANAPEETEVWGFFT